MENQVREQKIPYVGVSNLNPGACMQPYLGNFVFLGIITPSQTIWDISEYPGLLKMGLQWLCRAFFWARKKPKGIPQIPSGSKPSNIVNVTGSGVGFQCHHECPCTQLTGWHPHSRQKCLNNQAESDSADQRSVSKSLDSHRSLSTQFLSTSENRVSQAGVLLIPC